MERTERAATDSDLVLLVLDFTKDISKDEWSLLSQSSSSRQLVVMNKCDLVSPDVSCHDAMQSQINVSAKTGEGIEKLRELLVSSCADVHSDSEPGVVITNLRHHNLLNRTEAELEACLHLIRTKSSEELIVAPLHNALKLLGEVTGETSTEDLLAQIFSTFCIGK